MVSSGIDLALNIRLAIRRDLVFWDVQRRQYAVLSGDAEEICIRSQLESLEWDSIRSI